MFAFTLLRKDQVINWIIIYVVLSLFWFTALRFLVLTWNFSKILALNIQNDQCQDLKLKWILSSHMRHSFEFKLSKRLQVCVRHDISRILINLILDNFTEATSRYVIWGSQKTLIDCFIIFFVAFLLYLLIYYFENCLWSQKSAHSSSMF